MNNPKETHSENYSQNYGQLVKQTFVAGYPVAVCISNKEPEKHGNGVAAQLVQSYEERTKALDSTLDLARMNAIR